MSAGLLVTPRAEGHIESAFDWYESHKNGLGIEFLEALNVVLAEVQQFPELGYELQL